MMIGREALVETCNVNTRMEVELGIVGEETGMK